MLNSESMFRIAQMRHQELLQEAEKARLARIANASRAGRRSVWTALPALGVRLWERWVGRQCLGS